jgi:hypothetical protein
VSISGQISLFEEAKVAVTDPEPMTTVRIGFRVAQIPLRKKRREAVKRLMGILAELEGKDIYIGSYDAGGRHYWLNNLKLQRLQLEWHPIRLKSDHNYIPGVVVLWGSRSASIRIFTDYLVAVREQDYQGYWHYLLDFRNGFAESPIDSYRSHYACMAITRFKE